MRSRQYNCTAFPVRGTDYISWSALLQTESYLEEQLLGTLAVVFLRHHSQYAEDLNTEVSL